MAAVKNTMSITELRNMTYLDNGQAGYGTPAPWLNQRVAPTDMFGRLDTVGGTTYDWQVNGPACHEVYYDPMYGTHVMWMWSAEPGTPWNDRNQRYNYHNNASWQYNIGPDFLQWGLNAFTNRCGYGQLDVNPVTGCEYISGHLGASDHQYPAVSRDLTPGAGVFETDSGPPVIVSFLWPAIAVTHSEKVHVGMIDYPARTSLFYTNITWPDWLNPPVDFPPPAQEPGFPTHNLAASKTSNNVCMTWQADNAGSGGLQPFPAYYKTSDDDGANWTDPVQLPYPPTFAYVEGESLGPSFHISSVYPYYDLHDNLHIAASVYCAANESMLYTVPTEIWHYAEVPGTWSKVARAETDSLAGTVGYNVIYSSRPSLSSNPDGTELVCVWEQFDGYNVEPTTEKLRADIWGAFSPDNGLNWGAPVKLTDADETSKRFPNVAPFWKGDSVVIGYLVDLVAGFIVQSEGVSTNNPFVVQTVWTGADVFPRPGAVAEKPGRLPGRLSLAVAPNPVRTATTISYAMPKAGNVSLRIHDASGRIVRTLVSEHRAPGSYNATWDGRGDDGRRLVPGVYFSTLAAGREKLSGKITLLQ